MLAGIGLGSQGSEPVKATPATPTPTPPPITQEGAPVLEGAQEGDLTAPGAVEPEPKKEEPLSSRFAALARKEKAALKRAQEVKAREAEIEAREAKVREQEESYTLGKKDPIAALKRLGWSYEDITNHILNDQKPTPESEIKSVREEMAQWRKQQEEEKEKERLSLEDKKKADYDRAIEDFKSEMNEYIEQNTETYELINLHEQQELVYATIEEHYQTTLNAGKPKILSNKEACDLVESYLESQLEKLAQTKKFKSKYSAPQPEAEGQDKGATPVKTLTNNMQSSAAPSSLPAKTEQERLQRALAALSK
jgi:hypothetical protein